MDGSAAGVYIEHQVYGGRRGDMPTSFNHRRSQRRARLHLADSWNPIGDRPTPTTGLINGRSVTAKEGTATRTRPAPSCLTRRPRPLSGLSVGGLGPSGTTAAAAKAQIRGNLAGRSRDTGDEAGRATRLADERAVDSRLRTEYRTFILLPSRISVPGTQPYV